jgi:hypothetical protein
VTAPPAELFALLTWLAVHEPERYAEYHDRVDARAEWIGEHRKGRRAPLTIRCDRGCVIAYAGSTPHGALIEVRARASTVGPVLSDRRPVPVSEVRNPFRTDYRVPDRIDNYGVALPLAGAETVKVECSHGRTTLSCAALAAAIPVSDTAPPRSLTASRLTVH